MLVCQQEIETLDFYLAHPHTDFLVFDLSHQAPFLLHEAEKLNYKFYMGNSTRKVQSNWIQSWTFGFSSPVTLKIQLWNGACLYDYSKFDNAKEAPSLPEMEEVAAEVDGFRNSKNNLPMTGCGIIEFLIPKNITTINTQILGAELETDYSMYYTNAMRGGGNAVLIYDKVPFETHVDYHQLYAYIMKTKVFPQGIPRYVKGYREAKYAIYIITGGIAKVKKNGFPLLKSNKGNFMAGADGNWFSLYDELFTVSSVDLEVLAENYDVEGLEISESIVYSDMMAFKGEKYFGKAVDLIYRGRQENEGALKRYYKLLNEYMAGFFERTAKPFGWWRGFEKPPYDPNKKKQMTYKNPVIGIFITSYGRKMLSDLLHMFPHDKVIGYDTDCVFFAGTKEEVEHMPKIMAMMGDKPGQVHFDGIYADTIHYASKHYEGYDLETQEPFKKASGVSKSGKTKRWNRDKKIYETLEVKNEK